MASLRQQLACIGLSAPISVTRGYFGLTTGKCPQLTGAPSSLSLLDQMGALRGPHFHMNVIMVGSDLFTSADMVELDSAVHKARAIYKQQSVGVGRVLYFAIPVSMANGHEIINSDDEAGQLTNEWTVHNNGLDVFIVRDYSGTTIGLSPVGGPCNKDSGKMNGSVVEISNGTQQTARSCSHEMGHYLGLDHQNSRPDNLMCQSSAASSITTSVVLDGSQGAIIKGHCFMQGAC
jgi:hypothetical protein